MTYSIIARCGRTGLLGVATATSDMAVGARVPWVRSGTGAVVTQHRTDPRLGPRMLDILDAGATAEDAVRATVGSTPDADWRQLAAIGARGPAAAYTGARIDASAATTVLADDHAVVGNILAAPGVGPAVSAAFRADPSAELAERLVSALEAGLEAGGETDPLRSAALLVHGAQRFPLVDLRVDDHAEPLTELRRLWELYAPSAGEYVRRALHPDDATGRAPVPEGEARV
ncbi:DUF1028 domain-containing protein [Actinocorallia sp. A-T 12471]|uniref:DUF1028 domain-containing protein n=1 Tax=Actinocorallia sp. A-T 12471 TaxID=3089813 RepID=UPI0029CF2B7B|nr:DUF1028 domain-containing protein [Actinocorallia sp. A-T 12471]MDX6742305.1 DUF1028 domain-containing protein [Actinocorallia sp. A-T 12471]